MQIANVLLNGAGYVSLSATAGAYPPAIGGFITLGGQVGDSIFDNALSITDLRGIALEVGGSGNSLTHSGRISGDMAGDLLASADTTKLLNPGEIVDSSGGFDISASQQFIQKDGIICAPSGPAIEILAPAVPQTSRASTTRAPSSRASRRPFYRQ